MIRVLGCVPLDVVLLKEGFCKLISAVVEVTCGGLRERGREEKGFSG